MYILRLCVCEHIQYGIMWRHLILIKTPLHHRLSDKQPLSNAIKFFCE